MKTNIRWVFIISGLLLILFLGYIFKDKIFSRQNLQSSSNKIMITTSFYPLFNLVREIGGQNVEVTNITPAGAEPHDYEPTPQDITKISRSKILFLAGKGLESWGDKITQSLKNRKVIIIKMSDYIETVKNDPHFWLDPILYKKMTLVVRDNLIKVDKAHAAYYRENANRYLQELTKLDLDYKNGLKFCQLKEIVVSHNAFNYLARRYGFKSLYISGISPDEEPSAKRIAEIATLAKEKNIKYIFFETLVSSKIAKTIADEIKAQTLVLNPLEGLTSEEIKMGKSYVNIMEENLINLKKAMRCQ